MEENMQKAKLPAFCEHLHTDLGKTGFLNPRWREKDLIY